MRHRAPVELSISKVCEKCGKANVVMLAKLKGKPACDQCGEMLEISQGDIAAAGGMYVFAIATDEFVKVD